MLTVVLLTFFLLAAFLIALLVMWRSNLRNPLLRTWLLLVLLSTIGITMLLFFGAGIRWKLTF
jgi:hypothetical protein